MSLPNVITVGRKAELEQIARQIGEKVFSADDFPEALEILGRINCDLILLGGQFDPKGVEDFVVAAEKLSRDCVVVYANDEGGPHRAEHFAARPNFQFLTSQQEHHRLRDIVNQITRRVKHSAALTKGDEGRFFADPLAAAVSMVGQSDAVQQALKMITIVAQSSCNPILIVGQMGTGKELAAKAIHHLRHPNREFIAVNCASLSENLLESELFGHEKGAFTSADREKTGLLELAGEGSIFLDEISEMSPNLQAKLLRVIQEKTFRRVGGTKEMTCKATLMASSNRNLKKEVQANRFRGDLYHRLSIFPVLLSPLGSPQRRKDIPLLAEYFLKHSTICPQKAGRITSITKLALEVLQGYDWPGNIRELRNVIERAILLETTDKIGMSSIVIDPEEPRQIPLTPETASQEIKDFSLLKAEQELIARVLQETNWQKTKAAELLGISRATLYAKVKQHNIEAASLHPRDEESLEVLESAISA
jgi:DNA-binding NtrC family response regulator